MDLKIDIVPDTASHIRGWIQMVLAPNDLFSWNNKYNTYNEYNVTDTFTCIFLAMHTTYSVHAGILKPWRGCLPWLPVVFSSYHVFFLPLSGLNWRSLFPPWGSGPPFPKMAPPFTGSTHTPLPRSGTDMNMNMNKRMNINMNMNMNITLAWTHAVLQRHGQLSDQRIRLYLCDRNLNVYHHCQHELITKLWKLNFTESAIALSNSWKH